MVRARILIIGGGFGGVRTALDLDRKLSKKEAEITLVDKNSYHLFLPALYEVGSAFGVRKDKYQVKLRKTVAIPFSDIFENTNINFVQSEICQINLEKKEAVSRSGKIFSYDFLVLALGAETETFGIKGVGEYAYKFKTIDEALFLNEKMVQMFQDAAAGKRSQSVKFVIAGAGFNGIELAAELACCAKNLKEKCKLSGGCFSIKIIEAAPQILPRISEKERKTIRQRLNKLGVEIMENSRIEEVGPDFVQIQGGERFSSDFTVWTTGIRANSFLKNIPGLALDERGRIIVSKLLQVEDRNEVFAIGDNVVFNDLKTNKPVPALAYVAVDQGKVVAENIKRILKKKMVREVDKKQLVEYKPFYGVWVAPVGGKFAVAHMGGRFVVSGFLGWLIRGTIDFRYFSSILPFSKAVSLFTEEVEVFTRND